jgi:quinol-cytochrome oxidoreductase complex cytochrome b subunit
MQFIMPSLQQWLVENEMDSADTLLAAFVFVFILLSHSPLAIVAISLSYLIGNKHGKKETYHSGRQVGYREGIKGGLKQGSRQAKETKMQMLCSFAVVSFIVGALVGFKVAKVIFQR